MSKQPPPAPTTSAVGPCPTTIQIVGRPGTGSLPSTIASPDHPRQVFGQTGLIKQCSPRCLFRVYTICHSIFIFWKFMYNFIEKKNICSILGRALVAQWFKHFPVDPANSGSRTAIGGNLSNRNRGSVEFSPLIHHRSGPEVIKLFYAQLS